MSDVISGIRVIHSSRLFGIMASTRLTWWEEAGVGYYPVRTPEAKYDLEYFSNYQAMGKSELGAKLMKARVDFVKRHWADDLCDVGIGGGAFIEMWDFMTHISAEICGYDINPIAQGWLAAREAWIDLPKSPGVPAISMWDVLEHIDDWVPIVEKAQKYVFLCMPIYENAAHVLRSKNYRKDEHFWYFTHDGLVGAFDSLGFDLAEVDNAETILGREDIRSYAFKRREAK